jgi:uncharacterized protein YceH (UPF0502 family)
MTLNALRNACNQKSSRDPVSEYDEAALASALAGLKRKCLVTFIPYGSQGTQFKYRHFLEDIRFNLGRPELAVLAVLLLRGGQTLNEIRLRASSLEPIDSLETAEKVLRGLAERAEPLAEPLSKRPGWKEPRWRDTVRVHGEEPDSSVPPEITPREYRSHGSSGDLDALREEVAALRSEYAALKAIVEGIKAELGS